MAVLAPDPGPFPLISARKRPLPDFEEDHEEENEDDIFNFDPEPDLLPPAFAPVPIPCLRRSEDWVPGVTAAISEDISRNRDSLEKLFEDSQPVSPVRNVETRKSPRVPFLRPPGLRPAAALPTARKFSGRRGATTSRRDGRAPPESTEERILREAAEARAALHQRILRSSRMAAKFRAQNENRSKNRN